MAPRAVNTGARHRRSRLPCRHQATGCLQGTAAMPFRDREALRAYQRAWIARRRAEWLADKCCVACGSTDDLEVHHRDRNEKVTHRVWSWSRERREAELAKCEVRCRLCHFAEHGFHGTAQRYASGCTCAACLTASRVRTGQLELL